MPADDFLSRDADDGTGAVLSSLLSPLRAAADAVPHRGPAAARALTQRQDRNRSVATFLTVVLLVGAAIGVGWFGARGNQLPIVGSSPSTTPSATPSAEPSVEPSLEPSAEPSPTDIPDYLKISPVPAPPGCSGEDYFTAPPLPHAGEALPTAAMLTAADVGQCWAMMRDTPGYTVYAGQTGWLWAAPDPCLDHAPYPADSHRLAGRSRGFYGGPETGAGESLTRYAPGQAQAFLQQVRDKVAACATFPDPYNTPGEQHSQIVAQGFAGDDSLVVYTGPSPTPNEYPATYVGVVRVGDYVLVVEQGSDLASSLDHVRTLATKATNRFTPVLGGG